MGLGLNLVASTIRDVTIVQDLWRAKKAGLTLQEIQAARAAEQAAPADEEWWHPSRGMPNKWWHQAKFIALVAESEQVKLMQWALGHTTNLLADPNGKGWMSRWLSILGKEARDG